MKILFFGDLVGRPARQAIKKTLPKWEKKYAPDLIIANGENLAHGSGITEKSLNEILKAGVDVVTSGDHVWSQKQALSLLNDKETPLIRPANFPPHMPGQGYWMTEIRTKKILVVNMLGRVFMSRNYDDPIRSIDQILEENPADIVIVDFHAEATAEKVCFGWYLDGRVSAVLGTHTHIPTADFRILPKGTAYITDVGMVGVRDSSLGADKELAIKSMINQTSFKLEVAEGPVEVNAVLIEIDQKNKVKRIKQIQEIVK